MTKLATMPTALYGGGADAACVVTTALRSVSVHDGAAAKMLTAGASETGSALRCTTEPLTTSAAPILLGRTGSGAGADTGSNALVSFPGALAGPFAEEVGCKVTFSALAFERLTRWVAGASASETSGAPGAPAAGVAAFEDEADPRFSGAVVSASWDVVTAVRPASASTTAPGSAERFAGCDASAADVPWPIGDSVAVLVDPPAVDGVEADEFDTAPFPDDDAPATFRYAAVSAEELEAVGRTRIGRLGSRGPWRRGERGPNAESDC